MKRLTAVTKVNKLLISQGKNFTDLAQSTGISIGTLYNVASGGSTSPRARRKIEQALGLPIWLESQDSQANPEGK